MSDYCVLIGDCLDTLKTLPDQSVHTCVTSPPYFGLRDYGQDGQIGLEPTPEEFVTALVAVFREVRRVLRDDGTVWLNLGDSYSNGGRTWRAPDKKHGGRAMEQRPEDGMKPKDLLGIPWRVAFALQADGWYLRQDIIWHKPNPMPESVRDRCTKAHEYIFLLSKGPRYYYDAEAVKEPVQSNKGNGKTFRGGGSYTGGNSFNNHAVKARETHGNSPNLTGTRNRRSVWDVSTKPYAGAHFATFPPDLIEPCILAGAPEKCCAACGMPYRAVTERTDVPDPTAKGSRFDHGKTGGRDGGDRTQRGDRFLRRFVGYEPACKCGGGQVPGVVLDPFGGSGTTAGVAMAHGRDAVLCELSPDYAQLIPERVEWVQEYYRRRRAAPVTIVPDDDTPEGGAPGQITLFDAPTCSITEPSGLEVDHD